VPQQLRPNVASITVTSSTVTQSYVAIGLLVPE
jgi:hypothetical protein